MSRVLPLYLVVFAGFVGYSLMIAIFTPMLLRTDGGMLPRSDSVAQRTIPLGVLLALYPLAQFLAAPVIGGLSDTALALAICLPAAAAIISQAVPAQQQGGALGSNQSLQVGAEAIAGLAGGLLAAISTSWPRSR